MTTTTQSHWLTVRFGRDLASISHHLQEAILNYSMALQLVPVNRATERFDPPL